MTLPSTITFWNGGSSSSGSCGSSSISGSGSGSSGGGGSGGHGGRRRGTERRRRVCRIDSPARRVQLSDRCGVEVGADSEQGSARKNNRVPVGARGVKRRRGGRGVTGKEGGWGA